MGNILGKDDGSKCGNSGNLLEESKGNVNWTVKYERDLNKRR